MFVVYIRTFWNKTVVQRWFTTKPEIIFYINIYTLIKLLYPMINFCKIKTVFLLCKSWKKVCPLPKLLKKSNCYCLTCRWKINVNNTFALPKYGHHNLANRKHLFQIFLIEVNPNVFTAHLVLFNPVYGKKPFFITCYNTWIHSKNVFLFPLIS